MNDEEYRAFTAGLHGRDFEHPWAASGEVARGQDLINHKTFEKGIPGQHWQPGTALAKIGQRDSGYDGLHGFHGQHGGNIFIDSNFVCLLRKAVEEVGKGVAVLRKDTESLYDDGNDQGDEDRDSKLNMSRRLAKLGQHH